MTTSNVPSAKGSSVTSAADVDSGAETGGGVEPFGGFTVLGGEVDAGDVGADLCGEEASGSADPGAGIENAVLGAHTGEPDQLDGRGRPSEWKSSSGTRSVGERPPGSLPASLSACSMFARVRPVE
jgi:hypothetical protein